MTPSQQDAEVLERWWRHCLSNPGSLPPDVEPVLTRLVRAVGRGVLPDRGPVFVKVMSFPRLRHRLRYALRALPAVHEARMLGRARAAELTVPDVVLARALRAWGLPRQSMLVTAALDVVDDVPSPRPVAEAARSMADAGIHHPDLNPGNFAALEGGGIGLFDLQSARFLRTPLPARRRLAMAAKLLSERPDCGSALVEAGLIESSGLSDAERHAGEIRTAGCLRRIRRCLKHSTEFRVVRRWNGTLFERRALGPGSAGCIEGGSELVRYWIGERALEVLDGRPPLLRALFRKSWWFPGKHSVYIGEPGSERLSPAEGRALLEGHQRFLTVKTGRGSASSPGPGSV